MIEIIALLALAQLIGDMARRRGRSASGFKAMLLAFWLGGEFLGAVVYYLASQSPQASVNWAAVYGLALMGAVAGGILALLVAKMVRPVDGQWIDAAQEAPRRSRLKGAFVGGLSGGVLGVLVARFLYGDDSSAGQMMLQSFVAVSLFGALLGLVSGLQKE